MSSPETLQPLLAPIAAIQRVIEQIAFWVRQFAELLETPEIWTDVASLLKNR